MRLLIDANVPRFAAVSAYKKIAEQVIKWGPHQIKKDLLDWGPPPYERAPRFVQANVRFIPALAVHGREAQAEFFTYDLIEKEKWNVRHLQDWADRHIGALFAPSWIPFHVDTSGVMISAFDLGSFDRYLNSIPTRIADSKFVTLLNEMGLSFSRDCVHVWFADYHSLDGFVTMDKAFLGHFNQLRKKCGYKVRALSPEEACRALKIAPIEANWFAARVFPHIIYNDPWPIAVGEFIFVNPESQKVFGG